MSLWKLYVPYCVCKDGSDNHDKGLLEISLIVKSVSIDAESHDNIDQAATRKTKQNIAQTGLIRKEGSIAVFLVEHGVGIEVLVLHYVFEVPLWVPQH